jgi:esterase/lipase superfamily enzyme
MKREIYSWWSGSLNKEMEAAVYGHYGFALLLFPTADSDYLEYERFNLIDSISDQINRGIVKCFSINSINKESWLSNKKNAVDKGIRHHQYNNYVINEVIPFIKNSTSDETPIVLSGASYGAFHAANNFFRRSELFAGLIALSGVYDLKEFTKGYYDSNVYFNSPVDYLPGWNDENILNQLRSKKIIIASGQGEHESPSASIQLSSILKNKGIDHRLDLWGNDMDHDWKTWNQMLPYFLNQINL